MEEQIVLQQLGVTRSLLSPAVQQVANELDQQIVDLFDVNSEEPLS